MALQYTFPRSQPTNTPPTSCPIHATHPCHASCAGATYAIADTSYEVYDTTDPWPCPAPAAYAAPVNPGTPFEIEPTQNQLIARWSPPANAATAALVFGYEVGG